MLLECNTVQAVLTARIRTISLICKLCETVMHALFHCQFARVAWLASPLGIRSDLLSGNFKETIRNVKAVLSDRDFGDFLAMAWAVWRVRNDVVYGDKTPNFIICKEYYLRTKEANQILCLCTTIPGLKQHQSRGDEGRLRRAQVSHICYVDGSWDPSGRAGIGIILLHNGTVLEWVSRKVQAINPAKAEAQAILEGFRMLIKHANGSGLVLSDSQETIASLTAGFPNIQNWRSYAEIWQAWLLQAEMKGDLQCQYCNREDQQMQIPHRLANQARVYGWNRSGIYIQIL